MSISTGIINTEFARCFIKAKAIFPTPQWKHSFSTLEITALATKYGNSFRTGVVQISDAFVGTQAYAKLTETIMHELAHLITGLNQHHGYRFQGIFARLLQDEAVATESEKTTVKDNAPYKYRLLAYTAEGKALDCGGAHRRTNLYTGYSGGHQFRGDRIESYAYVPYCNALPDNVLRPEDL